MNSNLHSPLMNPTTLISKPKSSLPTGLGIDAGGTATRWALATAGGEIVAEGEVAGLSAIQMADVEGSEMVRATLTHLASAISAAVAVADVASVAAVAAPQQVCAGMTGFDKGSGKANDVGAAIIDLMANAFALPANRISLGNDIDIAYVDIFAPGEGYLVYAGTGTVAAFMDASGELHRAGGRGHLIDDAGGGYWIARQALRHIWRLEDAHPGGSYDSPLAVEMFKLLGGSDWAASRNFVYGGSSRGDIGKLALAVAAAAATDPAALAILQAAGVELARLAMVMTQRYGSRPMALAGRAIELHPVIEQSFRAQLPIDTDLKVVVGQAHYAAARIAAKQAGQNI